MYFVRYRKDLAHHNDGFCIQTGERVDIHVNMMDRLSQRILKDVDTSETGGRCRKTDLVKDSLIRRVYE